MRSLGGAGQEDPECEKAEKTRGKVSSSYPPIFRAKPGESYAEWKRAVHFWVGGEGDQLPMCYRGPRLMVQLRDRAAQLVRHLDLQDVQKSSGMELIFKTLEASPLVKQMDKHKVDQHRRRLMALDRVPGESLESYITRANIYRVQLQALDESLAMGERFYVGHLLDHARLSRKDKAMVRTRSTCETEQEVTSAMLDLASELEGEHGYPIGFSEPNMAGHQGEEFLVQKSSTYRKPTAPRAALLAMGDHAEELDETMSTEAGDGSASVDEEAIPELIEAEKEAYALQFRAKQRMAEVKKMRHFYQKRDPEERKRELAEKMKETHCHTCGEKGHWSRECPKKRAQQVLMASNAGKSQTARPKQRAALQGIPEGIQADQEWDLLVSLCSKTEPDVGEAAARGVYMALPRVCPIPPSSCSTTGSPALLADDQYDVLWNMNELEEGVILDLGCMKNVAGTGWANQLVRKWQAQGWWFRVVPEQEQFRFGNGSTLKSRFCIQFVATFLGRSVVLAFSVVAGDCPPLLSRPTCSALSAVFDCQKHAMSSSRLKIKNYGLIQTSGGHYMMKIAEFSDASPPWEPPLDFCMAIGQEVYVVPASPVDQTAECSKHEDIPVNALERQRSSAGTFSMSEMRGERPSDEAMPGQPQQGARGRLDRGAASSSEERGRGVDVSSVLSQSSQISSFSGRLQSTRGRLATSSAEPSENQGETSVNGERPREASEHRVLRDGGSRAVGDYPSGASRHHEAETEEGGSYSEEITTSSPDGSTGRLPDPLSEMEPRTDVEHVGESEISNGDIPMEEDALAAEVQTGLGAVGRGQAVAKKPPMASEAAHEGGRIPARPPWSGEAEDEQPGDFGAGLMEDYMVDMANAEVLQEVGFHPRPPRPRNLQGEKEQATLLDQSEQEPNDLMFPAVPKDSNGEPERASESDEEVLEEKAGRPQRGLTQQFKQKIKEVLIVMDQVKKLADENPVLSVMEVFAGSATLTMMAIHSGEWKVYEPVDILLDGTEHDLNRHVVREKIRRTVRVLKPDLVVMTPPCGPWSQWQNQRRDFETLDEERRRHLPYWKLTRDIWDEQTREVA